MAFAAFLASSILFEATYADLFALISTNWGSCGAGNFALPDLRGRFTAGVDGGANRITNGGSGCTATLHAGCGTQNRTITAANVPQLSVAITDPGHSHVQQSVVRNEAGLGGGTDIPGTIATANTSTSTTGITATANTSSPNTAFIVLNPVLIVNKIIKY